MGIELSARALIGIAISPDTIHLTPLNVVGTERTAWAAFRSGPPVRLSICALMR
jgi:hypothetical protein